jgi:hypothetical protein
MNTSRILLTLFQAVLKPRVVDIFLPNCLATLQGANFPLSHILSLSKPELAATEVFA